MYIFFVYVYIYMWFMFLYRLLLFVGSVLCKVIRLRGRFILCDLPLTTCREKMVLNPTQNSERFCITWESIKLCFPCYFSIHKNLKTLFIYIYNYIYICISPPEIIEH